MADRMGFNLINEVPFIRQIFYKSIEIKQFRYG